MPIVDMTEIVRVGSHFEISPCETSPCDKQFHIMRHQMKWRVVSCLVVCTLLNKLYGLFRWRLQVFGVVLLCSRLCWVDYLLFPPVSDLEPYESHKKVVFLKCLQTNHT